MEHCCQAPLLFSGSVEPHKSDSHMQAAFHFPMCHRVLSWSMIWSSLTSTLPTRYCATQHTMHEHIPCVQLCIPHKAMVPASLGHSTASVQSLCAAQVESRLMLSHAVLAQLKDRGQMTYEERLEAAERHRMTGNALFQQVDGQPVNARMCSFGLADIPNEASEASSMLLRALCVFLCTFRVLWHVRCEVRPTSSLLCGASAGGCFLHALA